MKATIVRVNEYFKQYETHLATSPTELPQFQTLAQDTQDLIHEDVLRDLEKDLCSLALRIGIRMWVRTTLHLHKKRKLNTEDFRKAMRPYIAKIIPYIQSSSGTKAAAAGSTG